MTTKPKDEAKPAAEEKGASSLFDMSRKVLLAGIGAMSLAQDEVEAFVNRLIERGEIAEKEGKTLVREVMDKRKKKMQEVEDEATKRVKEILDRMNVPTRRDVQTLSDKIAELTHKIDELKKTPPQA
jgi:poly(hydroxyalkanoate) granule-associated protein